MIDESEAGYYLVANGETKAMFIPRSAVAMVLFGDDPKKFHLMHGEASK